MFGYILKAAVVLVVIGAIFVAGIITGGSFVTSMTEDSILRRVEVCMPAQSAEELRPCLATGEGQTQP